MKKEIKKRALAVASKIILRTAEKEVNSACCLLGYQPEIPSNAQKLKKVRIA